MRPEGLLQTAKLRSGAANRLADLKHKTSFTFDIDYGAGCPKLLCVAKVANSHAKVHVRPTDNARKEEVCVVISTLLLVAGFGLVGT